MASFYQSPNNDRIWVYAERGLMAHLFHSLLSQDLSFALDRAVNLNGQKLSDGIGTDRPYRLITEFDLGKVGFGSPDGGIVIGLGQQKPAFIFVEGKQVVYEASAITPQASAWVNEQMQHLNGRAQVRKKIEGFNSSINGQLELKWRFVNALTAAPTNGIVSEQTVSLPAEITANDVFYMRNATFPDCQHFTKWRSVALNQLQGLDQILRSVSDFFLLAITADRNIPQGLQKIRLFDRQGQPLTDARHKIFWMSICDVAKSMVPV